MNKEQLFKALNNADDKFILEAEKTTKKRVVWRTALTCAACLSLAVAVAAVYKGRNVRLHGAADASPETTVSSEQPIQSCEPLELPTVDDAEFWTGELPVMPLKDFVFGGGWEFELGLDRQNGMSLSYLETERGRAVYAVADGEVVFCGVRGSDGFTVIIKVNDALYTSYSMLDYDCGANVSEGDIVSAGQVIGYAGMSVFNGELDGGVCYTVYAYDPLEVQTLVDEDVLEGWINLCVPIDGAENFDFFNTTALISRSEHVTPAPRGTEVRAVDDGVVAGMSTDRDGGLEIQICHDNGIRSVYYHLDSSAPYPEDGTRVKKGDVIGQVSGKSYSGVSGLGYYIMWEGRTW